MKMSIGALVLSLLMMGSLEARYKQKSMWAKAADRVEGLIEHRAGAEKCVATSTAELSKRFMATRDANGKLCKIYDLSFPTLSTLFAKKPASTLRIKKANLDDYRNFLYGKVGELEGREFLEQEITQKDLQNSWYGQLKFKPNRNLRVHRDGVIESFQFSDVEMFSQKIAFNQEQKKYLRSMLSSMGAERSSTENFINNPRNFLENITFEYDSLKRAYEVFLDFDFLPIRGPIASVDHDLQYRGWMQKQIRRLVLSAINKLLQPASLTVTGRIATVVINDAFELIEMTYDFQRAQLDQVIRMALAGTITTPLSQKELQDSLYLLYVQDSQTVVAIIQKLIQTGTASIDNLYPYGKAASIQSYNMKVSLSDSNFSKLYYELACDLKDIGYFFARCDGGDEVYSTLSESKFLFWNMGQTKIINLAKPWEVYTKRMMAYLLAGGVEVFLMNFPDWITSNVISALKGYATAGVIDEAYVVSDIYEKSSRGLRVTNFERETYLNIMDKNFIPFLPKSEESLNNVVATHRRMLTTKLGL